MFTAILYTFSKPTNSTKTPSGEGNTFACRMVAPSGILNPTFTFNLGVNQNPSFWNYCRIEEFGRYYWITEWVWENGVWNAYMEVDPLASWKKEILASSEYVLRSASAYTPSAMDTLYPATARVSQASATLDVWPVKTLEAGSCVVGVLGNNNAVTGGVAYFLTSAMLLNAFFNKVMGSTEWIGSVTEISDELLKCLVNPMQYVTSVMWLPLQPWSTGGGSTVWLGWWDSGYPMSNLSDLPVGIAGNFGERPSHPQSGRGTYLNKSPYTEITLNFPPFGKIALDPYKYPEGKTIRYSISIDPISGMGTLYIYTDTLGDGDMLQCKIGVDFSVGQSNASTLGAAGSAISTLAKVPSVGGDPVMYGAAGAKHPKNASIGDTMNALFGEVLTIGQNGGVSSYQHKATLTVRFHYVVEDDNTHLGRPLCEQRTLSSLSGYTVVMDADADIPATSTEKAQIVSYLEGGFYIE